MSRERRSPELPIPNAFVDIKKNQLQFYPIMKKREASYQLSFSEYIQVVKHACLSWSPAVISPWNIQKPGVRNNPKRLQNHLPKETAGKPPSAYIFCCQTFIFNWNCLTSLCVAHIAFILEYEFISNINVSLTLAENWKLEVAQSHQSEMFSPHLCSSRNIFISLPQTYNVNWFGQLSISQLPCY